MGRLTREQLKDIIGDSKINTLIETGTCEGGFAIIAASVFNKVITIELNSYYYERAKKELQFIDNVELINGNSIDVLKNILPKQKRPLVFYLDAHFFNPDNSESPLIPRSEFPLFKELELIKTRNKKDIVIIDDVHTFGRERPELRYKNQPDWELVNTESILNSIGTYTKYDVIDDAFIIWK